MTQRRNTGIRHRERTTRSLLRLIVEVRERRARDVRARLTLVSPCEVRHTMLDTELHDAMIRWMELDEVRAMTVAIDRTEFRPVLVGQYAELHQLATRDQTVGRNVGL